MADKAVEHEKSLEKTDKTEELPKLWPMWVLIAFGFLGLIILYPLLPDQFPTHWNFRWEADETGHKSVVFWQAVLPAVFLAAMEYLPRRKRWKEMRDMQKKTYRIMEILITSLLLMMTWLPVFGVLNDNFQIGRSLPVIMGFYMVILGNYMPTIQPNRFFGVRAPWIRKDKRVWKKAQRAGGILLVVFGILLILAGIIGDTTFYMICSWIMTAGIIGVYLYSFLLKRRIKAGEKEEEKRNKE